MSKVKVFTSTNDFTKEFIRCTRVYNHLKIAVAWCGNPEQTLPYKYLEEFEGKIEVVLGHSFYHTHPDSFTWFRELNANLKIFRKQIGLFHPKIYLFLKANRYAIFIGSSNLTNSGFYLNFETNTLIEGIKGKKKNEFQKIENQFKEWQNNNFSFNLSEQWLIDYRKKYKLNAKKEKDSGITSPRIIDEEIGTASWLKNADWATYYKQMQKTIREYDINSDSYFKVFNASKKNLKLPWKTSYFKNVENRKIIEGIREYAALGWIAASGRLLKLFAGEEKKEWKIIVKSINSITRMNPPLDWKKFELELEKLVNIGFTMKVWGRLLCITRPELYPTISSDSVRSNLSKLIKVPKSSFPTPAGYIKFVKMIHSSPWFNSKVPVNKNELQYWENRVALMDIIFYK